MGIRGNPVQIGSGPAAVIGDEIRNGHCFVEFRNGKAWKVDGSESQKTCLADCRPAADYSDGAKAINPMRMQAFMNRFS